jgi:Ca2+-binding EF-hand superfamily protein
MAVHHLFILALAALPLVTSEAAAQDPTRYRAWDRNNDGVITRSEWRGNILTFRELDWNGDGVLSGNERRDPDQRSVGREWRAETFVALDRNRDGRLSRPEWTSDRALFERVDRNKDNFITRGEFLNANVAYDDYDLTDFNAIDDDGSGRIERREWTGTAGTFHRLDRNNDGMLTRRELAANDVARASADDFVMLDDNANGVISRSEWRSGYGSFNDYDLNRDGAINRREYALGDRDRDDVVSRRAVTVDSRAPWTSTGMHVNAGDIVTYQADGVIQMSTNPDDRATPNGSVSGRNATNAPRPDQRAGILLARVGGGPVIALGANASFTAQTSGELLLGVNDDHFPDNSGEFDVSLSIQRR